MFFKMCGFLALVHQSSKKHLAKAPRRDPFEYKADLYDLNIPVPVYDLNVPVPGTELGHYGRFVS